MIMHPQPERQRVVADQDAFQLCLHPARQNRKAFRLPFRGRQRPGLIQLQGGSRFVPARNDVIRPQAHPLHLLPSGALQRLLNAHHIEFFGLINGKIIGRYFGKILIGQSGDTEGSRGSPHSQRGFRPHIVHRHLKALRQSGLRIIPHVHRPGQAAVVFLLQGKKLPGQSVLRGFRKRFRHFRREGGNIAVRQGKRKGDHLIRSSAAVSHRFHPDHAGNRLNPVQPHEIVTGECQGIRLFLPGPKIIEREIGFNGPDPVQDQRIRPDVESFPSPVLRIDPQR